MGTAFLEVYRDVSAFGSILSGIGQQVPEDMRDVLLVDHAAHLRSLHGQLNIILYLASNLIEQLFAEGHHLHLFQFHWLIRLALQCSQGLNVAREVLKGLHLRYAAVKLLQRGIQLRRDIADELRLQGIVLIGLFYGILLLARENDVAHQHDSPQHEQSCQCGRKYAEADNNHPSGAQ